MVALGAYVSTAPQIEPGPTPQFEQTASLVSIEPASLSFGEVWETDSLQLAIPVTNLSPKAIRIDGVTCGCRDFRASPPTIDLQPGQAQQIHLTLNADARPQDSGDVFDLAVQLQMRATEEGPDGQVQVPRVTLSGRVKRVFRTAAVWNYGEHSQLARPMPERSYKLTSTVPLSRVELDPAMSDLAGLEVAIDPPTGGYEYMVRVKVGEGIGLGRISRRITFRAVPRNSQPLPTKTVRLEGVVVPDLVTEPREVDFGPIKSGAAATQAIRLVSLTGRAVSIDGVRTNSSLVTAGKKQNGSSAECWVKCEPQAAGAVTAVVTIECSTVDGKFAVAVPVAADAVVLQQ